LYLRIDFIASRNTITPATSRAVPTSRVTPEFEAFMDNHINSPTVIKLPEINISRRWALRIRIREELNSIVVAILVL
jgi:hypothetical protein